MLTLMPRRAAWRVSSFCLLVVATLVAQAPPPAEFAAEQGLEQSLDFEALLTSPDVLPQSVGDNVWDFQPATGKRFIQVPVRVEPGETDLVLGNPGVGLRGRFVAWRVVPDDQTNSTAPGTPVQDPNAATVGSSRNLSDLFLMNGNNFDLSGQRQQPQDPARNAINTAAAVLDGGLPPDAPTFTRELVVTPDGSLKWDLARSIAGGKVKAGEGYSLKLNRELLAERQPKQPAVTDPLQRREQQALFRQQMEEFKALSDQVRRLPEQFEVALPSRLWAVYEVPASAAQLAYTGPPPLPWSIELSELEALRGAAAGRVGTLDAASIQRIGVMLNMARDNHPLSHRAAAMALSKGGLVGLSTVNDTLYQLLQSIIKGPDDEARAMVVEGLALTIPPTNATLQLLRESTRYMTPELQLVSLKGLLQSGASDPAQTREMLENANRTLADPNGPNPGVALQAIAEGVTDPSGSTSQTLTSGIRFESLPPDRRDAAIAYVIRAAGTQPLAAAWLNHRLLGSTDQKLVRRSYELLSRASGSAGVLSPVGKGLLGVVFGDGEKPTTFDSGPKEAAPLDLTLSGLIPLDSANHSLFRGINSGDSSLRDLAWASVANFGIGASTSTPAMGQISAPADPAAMEQAVTELVTAGLSRKPAPPQLATFLANQKTNPAATKGLIQLVLAADSATAKQAARGLLGSGRDLATPLNELPPDQRAEFAGQLYQNLRGRTPAVVGLLADPTAGASLTPWFTQQVALGELPEPAAWAAQAGDEQMLLSAAGSADARVAAGGVGGLVAGAGGDPATADEYVTRFRSASDRTPTGLAVAWADAKKEIYARRLGSAKGPYRVVVRLYETSGTDGMPPMGPPQYYGPMGPNGPMGEGPAFTTPPTRTISVGVIDLNVDGQAVYLGNQTVNFTVPEDRLSLQLTATDLKNLQNDELKDVTLEHVAEPMRLLPQEDGSWRGSGTMLEGTGVEVVLEPAKQQ